MQLKLETVNLCLLDFARCYGTPNHLDSSKKIQTANEIYHRELSKHFDENSFRAAESTAWTKARRFPVVADFFEGFDGKKVAPSATLDGYKF